jgi:Flp pilus assembly CpaE family ATPase
MLRAILVTSNANLRGRLEQITSWTSSATIEHVVACYPDTKSLERLVRTVVPDAVFLDVAQVDAAIAAARHVQSIVPGTQVVAVGESNDPGVLMELMRAGFREFLPFPFQDSDFLSLAERVSSRCAESPVAANLSEAVISFLPAKSGCGCSTVAANASVRISQLPDTKALLIDLDLNSGLLGFMFKLKSEMGMYEGAENAAKLDEALWRKLVSPVGDLDVVQSGTLDPRRRVEAEQVRKLLHFAQRLYSVICLDHSGNLEKYSLELLRDSKKIFVVCTPEIPAVHLARKKVQLLQNLDLGDRTAILLNRSGKNSLISTAEIERLLGVPVTLELPNDYTGVHQALTRGTSVPADSELGRGFAELAHIALGRKLEPEAPAKRGLLDLLGFAQKSPAQAQ